MNVDDVIEHYDWMAHFITIIIYQSYIKPKILVYGSDKFCLYLYKSHFHITFFHEAVTLKQIVGFANTIYVALDWVCRENDRLTQ